jgi:uncharacterized protein (DUF736 family)
MMAGRSGTPEARGGQVTEEDGCNCSEVRIVANDRKETEGAPDFRIMAGSVEIGAAWRKTKQGTDDNYLRVRLDDPAWPQPVWGALLEATEDGVVRLVWRRKDDA